MAIRSLARYLDLLSGTEDASIYTGDVMLARHLYEWRQHNPRNVARRTKSVAYLSILVLIRRASLSGRTLQNGLAELSRVQVRLGESNPLDEFSNAERLAMVRCATASVAACEARLARTAELIGSESGQAALRFAMSHTYVESKEMLLRSTTLLQALSEVGVVITRSSRALAAVRDLLQAAAPSAMEIMSMQVLLMWATGLAPEQITDTKVGNLDFDEKGLTWHTYKARAMKLQRPVFRDPASLQPWGTVGLFRRALAMTSLARTIVDEHEELWLAAQTMSAPAVGAIRRPSTRKVTFPYWVKLHGLDISQPHDSRRIRKAVKAVRAGISGSAASAAGEDHTLATFNRHYLPVTSVIAASALTIERAQKRLMERVESRSRVVTTSAAAFIDHAQEADGIGKIAVIVNAESQSERALSISACTDPYDDPNATGAGTLCRSAPFSCLSCKNSVAFVDHLPQLLLLREHIDQLRDTLTPPDFIERWGVRSEQLDDMIGRFSEGAVHDAHSKVARKQEELHLPISARVEFGK